MVSPSGRVRKRAPDLFFVATEACGGGTPDLGFFSGVLVFIGIFGVGLTSGGLQVVHDIGGRAQGVGRAPTLAMARDSSGTLSVSKPADLG